MNRIQEYNKDARYYTSDNSLNLMKGPSHSEDHHMNPLPENVVKACRMKIGGGDW